MKRINMAELAATFDVLPDSFQQEMIQSIVMVEDGIYHYVIKFSNNGEHVASLSGSIYGGESVPIARRSDIRKFKFSIEGELDPIELIAIGSAVANITGYINPTLSDSIIENTVNKS